MKRKNLLKVFSAFAVSALAAGALAIGTPTVEASAATPETFEMQAGASVRLPVGDETVYGIKYTAQIHSSEYVETDKYYVMIIPTGWLKTYSLTKGCDYYDILVNQNGKVATGENRTINIMESTPKAKGDLYTISGSIVDVKYANSYREFFGIVYKTDANGENRVYAEFNEGENVRSISQVASAALNHLSYGYTTDQKDDLRNLVTDGYNAWLGNPSATEELPTVSAESVALALEKDKTYQLNAPDSSDEFIEKLGLDVDYTTTDETQTTVTDEGLVTIKADDAQATVKSLVLGQEYTVANIVQDSIVLHDFSSAESYKDVRTLTNGSYTATHYEEKALGTETRNGVVGIPYDTVNRKFYFTFDYALEKLKFIGEDFDYISISLYVETEATGTVQNTSWSMMGETISVNEWCDLKISKDFITADGSESFWSYYKDNQSEVATWGDKTVSDYFWYCHARDGKGIYADRPLIRFDGSFTSAATLYVDAVTLVRSEFDYVAPEVGAEVEASSAYMKGINGAIMATAPATVSHQYTSASEASDITLTDGKFTAKVGIYTLNYNFVYDGKNYSTKDSFSVARPTMAANALEDFDGPESVAHLWNPYESTMPDGNKGQNVWLESYTDSNSVTKTGVVSVNGYQNDMRLKFNRTAEELKALGLDENDTISITILWTGVTWNITPTVFGVALTAKMPNTWNTYEISVADIIAKNTDLDTFLTNAGSDGAGVSIKGNAGGSSTLYVSDISFTVNANE